MEGAAEPEVKPNGSTAKEETTFKVKEEERVGDIANSDESEELNEVRDHSGIDYEGDDVPTGEEEEDDDEEDMAAADVNVTQEEKKLKEKLLREDEENFEKQRSQQLQSLEALKSATVQDEDWIQAPAKQRRMDFLMAQSDVFTSFLMGGTSSVGKAMVKRKGSKAAAASGSPNRRGQKKDDSADNEAMLAMEESRFTRLDKQPSNIKFGTMRPFQIEGLNWMIRLHDCGVNGILADEMGLGKTLQTISLLAYMREARGINGPHIIIVPKSTVGNWMKELHRWCPSIRAFRFMGNKQERAAIRDSRHVGNFDACVLSYEIAIIEKAWLRKIKWKYLVIDEAHRIKNEHSKLSLVVREFKVDHRLLITGTPLQNNLHELWALLNFLLPDIFTDSEDFDEWFNIEDEDGQQNVIKKLHTVLRPFLLRRLKADVAHSLPPKTETKLYIGISEMQREWYTRVLQKDATHLNAIGGSDRIRLLNILMQLRKVCNHPYLFEGAEPQPFQDGPHLWENCGKLLLLSKLLPKLKSQGSRVLIFCQMTRMLDILEDFMRFHCYEYCRLDGSTKGEDRDDMMDAFNAPNSSKFCFLLSTRAGGLGINLATADIVVLYDSDWNPQVDLQAMDRAHRIGQTKPVRVFRFISEGTVEEKIVERAERKLYLDAAVIQQGRLAEQNRKLSKDDIMSMVRFGADEIFNAKGSTITDDDIDAILAKGEERTEAMKKNIAEDMQHNLKNFSLSGGGEAANLYELEGEFVAATNDTGKVMPSTFIALPQRERKKNYDVDEYYRTHVGGRRNKKNREARAKPPTIHDFQFFNQDKLMKLLLKKFELDTKRRQVMKTFRETRAEEQKEVKRREKEGLDPLTEFESDKLEREAKTLVLSDKDTAEMERLEAEGFPDWSRRDLREFITACERYGRDAPQEICQEVAALTGKTVERVEQYYQVFWDRYEEIVDHAKILERVEKGEKKIERNRVITQALADKCARYSNPWRDLSLVYPANVREKGFSHEEDVFLVCLMNKHGVNADWADMKDEIRKAWQFRFDWFIKSRTVAELQRRGEFLCRIVEKENNELESKRKAEEKSLKKKKKDATSLKASGKKKASSKRKGGSTTTSSSKKKKKQRSK